MKFRDLAEDSNTGGPSSFTVRMKYLHFNSDIVNFVWKTDEGEGGGRKHYFVNFCYLALLYFSVGERLWVGAESLI